MIGFQLVYYSRHIHLNILTASRASNFAVRVKHTSQGLLVSKPSEGSEIIPALKLSDKESHIIFIICFLKFHPSVSRISGTEPGYYYSSCSSVPIVYRVYMSPQKEPRGSMKIDTFKMVWRESIHASSLTGKSTFCCCNGIVKNGCYGLNTFPQKFVYHKHNDMLIAFGGIRAFGIIRIR